MRSDHSSAKSSTCPSPWSREACKSSVRSPACAPVSSNAPWRTAQKAETQGSPVKPCHSCAKIQVEERLSGPGLAGLLVFQCQKGWVADQQSRIGHRQHGFQDRWMGNKLGWNLPKGMEQNAGVCIRCARRRVGRDGPHSADSLPCTDHQDDGAYPVQSSNGAAGYDRQRGSRRMGGNGDQADIRLACSQLASTSRGRGVTDLVAFPQIAAPGLVFEVPH